MRFHLDRSLLVIALIILWMLCYNEERRNLQRITLHPKIPGTKNIHFWERPGWISKYSFKNCKQKCTMTEGKYIPANSDAVIFHSPTLWLSRAPKKPQGQIWVFHGLEPPVNYKLSFNSWYNVFNWTMTYRRDADIHHPYGIFQPGSTLTNRIRNTSKPWVKTTAAWFVGNCRTQSKREEFVELLKMYLDIDVYGYCGTLVCNKVGHDTACMTQVDKSYNFYLSFESSLCRDYVTEKFFKVYQVSSVIPVVRGNTYYAMYGPPGSYVDTSNFTAAGTLSRHLISVATSENLISTFFKFRQSYYMDDSHSTPFCELCRRMHNASAYQRLYGDIGHWFHGSDHVPICIRPTDLK